jgi:CRISPR/Cas system CMR-associated protein Cmr5 small subunit
VKKFLHIGNSLATRNYFVHCAIKCIKLPRTILKNQLKANNMYYIVEVTPNHAGNILTIENTCTVQTSPDWNESVTWLVKAKDKNNAYDKTKKWLDESYITDKKYTPDYKIHVKDTLI